MQTGLSKVHACFHPDVKLADSVDVVVVVDYDSSNKDAIANHVDSFDHVHRV
jgi:hypothetical protein